jgi:hypothetical protein
MALRSKKKIQSKITSYLNDKNISYSIENENIKFELCFTESGFMLFPYITVDEKKELISININVNHINVKHNGYSILNEINKNAIFLKAYITDESILVLEYRFSITDDVTSVIDNVLKDLFSLENIIEKL